LTRRWRTPHSDRGRPHQKPTNPAHPVVRFNQGHDSHTRFRHRPLLAAVLDIAGCQVLGLDWDPGDHSIRHDGERPWNKVYPVALAPCAGSTVLRWAIPPHHDEGGVEP
jgi:hypothetical protein